MTNDTNVVPFPKRRDTTSWTEVSTRRQCPHKHKLHYIDGWRTPKIARPLAIGILWHDIMDLHYSSLMTQKGKRGAPDLEPIMERFKEAGAKDPDHPGYDIAQTCLWMYDGYRRRYGVDPEWEFIKVEEELRVEIPGTGIVLVGRLDLLVRWKRRHLWVVDHKAQRYLPHDKDHDLDDQTPLYIWLLKQAGFTEVSGAIFNSARTDRLKTRELELDERFGRYSTFRTDYELERVVEEAAATINSAYGPDATYERHPDPQNCTWRCQFVEPCIAGRKAPHLEEAMLRSGGFTTPADRKAADKVETALVVGPRPPKQGT